MKYTISQFHKEFPDEDACLDTIFQNRYGDLDTCPKCGVIDTKFYKLDGRKAYSCMHCRYQLHPLAGTIFHKSETPLKNWFYAIYLFSVSKNGLSAKEIERHLGVTYKTAWRMAKQIRMLMQQDNEKLSGTIEADETHYGGKYPRSKGSTFDNKTLIIGVVEKGGSAKAVVARGGANTTTAIPFLKATVENRSTIHTDESRIYSRVKRDFAHEFVNHSKHEYVKAGIHTNTIEGFWGNMKTTISGTYHCVSPKYLQTYVNEFVYRYNLRDAAVYPVLIQQAGKRV